MIREATGMDLSKMAEIYEEFHLMRCRIRPDIYRPPTEDSYYFNDLSERLLYGDDEIIVSEDDESGAINGYCVYTLYTPDEPLLKKADYCRIDMLVIRRGSENKGIDGKMLEYVRSFAAENGCVRVEYLADGGELEMCEDNGFEVRDIMVELRLKNI